MHGCCPKSCRLQALPFTASAVWQFPPAQRCGVLCGGLEVFVMLHQRGPEGAQHRGVLLAAERHTWTACLRQRSK
jgi:hypothetical protein